MSHKLFSLIVVINLSGTHIRYNKRVKKSIYIAFNTRLTYSTFTYIISNEPGLGGGAPPSVISKDPPGLGAPPSLIPDDPGLG